MEYQVKELKEDYNVFAGEHGLPGFDELNVIFEIEKINRKSEILLKLVRKVMMEKIMNALSFLEMLLNPVNAPRMYMAYVKMMSVEDKKILDVLYGSFSELSLESIGIEFKGSEKEEAELVKRIYKIWKENEGNFGKIIDKVKVPSEEVKKERGYFG